MSLRLAFKSMVILQLLWLYHLHQPNVLLHAQALSIRIMTRPVGPSRVAKTLVGGLVRTFRTTTTTTTTIAKDTEQTPQVYNLGLQPAIHTSRKSRSSSRMPSQLASAYTTAQALPLMDFELYDATAPIGHVKVRELQKRRQVQKVTAATKTISTTTTTTPSKVPDVVVDVPVQIEAESVVATVTTTDVVVEPTTDTASAVAIDTDSLIGSLVQPFQACMIDDDTDIDMDCLLDACKRFKDAMVAFGQKTMGENLGQNVEKVERARAMAPPEHRRTLRSLLQYEKTSGVRPSPDAKLRKDSAALSLLWIRRSIDFQHRLNTHLVERPELSSLDAAMLAYEETVQPFHSWGLQKIFKVALRSTTPPRPKLLARFHGILNNENDNATDMDASEEAQTIQELQAFCKVCNPLLKQWVSTFETLGLEDLSKA